MGYESSGDGSNCGMMNQGALYTDRCVSAFRIVWYADSMFLQTVVTHVSKDTAS